MKARSFTACLVVMLGVMMVTGAGCSKKSVQAGSGSKSSEERLAKSRSGSVTPGESLNEGSLGMSGGAGDIGQGAGASSSFPDLTVSGRGTDAASAGSEGGGLRGLEPVGPGKGATEERVGGGTLMAKVQPSDSASRQIEEMRREQAAAAAAGLRDVFFAFDSWTITEEGRMALAHDAEWIKANPGSLIKIEGHCDERGTLAYNLVLGEKRAKAVRNYLVELGVSANRLAVVSYGKERPFCREQTESCYQQNRRGHLVLRTK
ncbi:MAG TPA: peptidoglycan-associated lipoprotein Pal [Nitrospiraceae bacterium]|jgi:peptidoglycan-associated lipoprotein|nr:peptidoglycan-associated lipoprotein Pal [Nitrospiraceae bacterium]